MIAEVLPSTSGIATADYGKRKEHAHLYYIDIFPPSQKFQVFKATE
jgi:hypothetical protein